MNRQEVLDIIEKARSENIRIDLRDADLEGANLRDADLRSVDLRSANLYGTDLRSADLRYDNLEGADLRSADLRSADLRGADLEGADLRYANLEGADLRSADLTGAYLTHCKGILSFTGEKHLLIYFKHKGIYYAKIGCRTKTIQEWLVEFDEVGDKECYDVETIKLYGEILKVFSGYEIV